MTSERLVAAVDQGSSSTKGAVVTSTGSRLAEISIPVALESSGRAVHHDPEEIASSVEEVLVHLLESHPVVAIGVTCQRSTCLLWDRATGRALTPALSWQDTSQSAGASALAEHAATVAQTTGLRLSPYYAATKLAALLGDLPDGRALAEAGKIVAGTLDAYLIRRLTGSDGTEPGHAGRTLLFDLERGDWSPTLAELFGIPLAALPPIRTSAGVWGSFRGVPLTAVAGDQQAALVGHGGWNEGTTAVHFGTGAFVLAGTGPRLLRVENALSAVVASTPVATRFQIEATVNSAGSAVDWACQLGRERLEDWQGRPLDPDALPAVFPAFRGAGAPWWRPDARTVISDIAVDRSGEQLLGGVLVGVAMRVLDCVELLGQTVTIDRLRVSGKLTRLEGLTGLLADAGGIPVEIAADEEVGLLGIARLAIAGLDGDEDHLPEPPPLAARREPRWPKERAKETRERWLAFSRAAIDLGAAR